MLTHLLCVFTADDFIVDDSGRPIKRKKYRDELSDS